MASSWAPFRNTMELLSGLFSFHDTPPWEPNYDGLGISSVEDLRRVIESAEWEGIESDALDDLRQRLEEIEQEAQKELNIHVIQAFTGDEMTVVRARPSDTAFVLREGVIKETGDSLVALRFLFGDRVLGDSETLEEAGIRNGDSVSVVRSPLRCLTAAFDGTSRVSTLRNGVFSTQDMVAIESGPVLSASLSPCGGYVLAVCSTGEGCVRSSTSGELKFQLSGWVASGVFSSDGYLIAGASDAGTARIWCAKSGKCLHVLSVHTEDVKSATFSPDNTVIVTAASDRTGALWHAETGAMLARLIGHSDIVRSGIFSPNGTRVLTTSMDATARLWQSSNGDCCQVLEGHSKALSGAEFSPDGQRVLTASFDGTVRVWDALTSQCLLLLPAENNVVNAAAFSPDGSSVLVASASESLRLFSADTGECRFTLSGHEDWVRVATFSPDGMLVASGSYDGTARIWNALDGQCVHMLECHTGTVVTAAISAA